MRLRKRIGKLGVTWFIDYKDQTGRRVYHTIKGITEKKHAEIFFADFRLKYERHLVGLPTDENITVGEAMAELIKKRTLDGCSSIWIKTLGYMRRTLIRFFGKDRFFKSINDDELSRFRIHRQEVENVQVETVNKELAAISAAGRVILNRGIIGRLPWNKVVFAIDRTGRQTWSYMREEEAARLLGLLRHGGKCLTMRSNDRPMNFDFQPRPRLWAMVTFLLNTGARKKEMFSVRWGDVDMEAKLVRLIGFKSARNGKSAPSRYIPLNAALEELFSELPRGDARATVFKEDVNMKRDLRHALRCAGLPHFRIHDLRHTYASALVRHGVPLYTVSKLLGHASLEMTQRYAHLCPDTLASAMQKLRFKTPEKTDP